MNYQEYKFGEKTIYVAIEGADTDGKEDTIKHLIIVDNGKAQILTSYEVKTIPDIANLVKKSIR